MAQFMFQAALLYTSDTLSFSFIMHFGFDHFRVKRSYKQVLVIL